MGYYEHLKHATSFLLSKTDKIYKDSDNDNRYVYFQSVPSESELPNLPPEVSVMNPIMMVEPSIDGKSPVAFDKMKKESSGLSKMISGMFSGGSGEKKKETTADVPIAAAPSTDSTPAVTNTEGGVAAEVVVATAATADPSMSKADTGAPVAYAQQANPYPSMPGSAVGQVNNSYSQQPPQQQQQYMQQYPPQQQQSMIPTQQYPPAYSFPAGTSNMGYPGSNNNQQQYTPQQQQPYPPQQQQQGVNYNSNGYAPNPGYSPYPSLSGDNSGKMIPPATSTAAYASNVPYNMPSAPSAPSAPGYNNATYVSNPSTGYNPSSMPPAVQAQPAMSDEEYARQLQAQYNSEAASAPPVATTAAPVTTSAPPPPPTNPGSAGGFTLF